MLTKKIKILLTLFLLSSLFFVSPIFAQYDECGDGTCGGDETCSSCPTDCGSCGCDNDGVCEASETYTSCPNDCSAGGSCGDGYCLDDETYENCPEDCPEDDPTTACDSGTCPDESMYFVYCEPSCTAQPRTCWNDPDCSDSPPNCTDSSTCGLSGYESVPGGCCPPGPDCAGSFDCGQVKCASGGNCYSDCTDCDSDCVSCNGSCSVDADCCGGNVCSGDLCRNPSCTGETDCQCPGCSSCNQSCSTDSDCCSNIPNRDCVGDVCRNSECSGETDCDCTCQGACSTTPVINSPADGSTNVHTSTVTLDWQPISHWGTSENDGGTYCCTDGDWPDASCSTRRVRAYLDTVDATTQVCDLAVSESSEPTECDVPNLQVNTTYYWKVCADNTKMGCTKCTDVYTFTPTNVPPNQPTGLSEAIDCADIDLSWNHDDEWGVNFDGHNDNFYVYLRRDSAVYGDLGANPICSVASGGTYQCSFNINDYYSSSLEDTYYYLVRASNDGADFSDANTYSEAEDSFSLAHTQPDAPTSLSPQGDINTDDISFSWNGLANADAWGCNLAGNTNTYRVELRETSGSYGDVGDWDPLCDRTDSECTNGTSGCGDGDCIEDVDYGTDYTWRVITNNGELTNETEVTFLPFYSGWFQASGGNVHGDQVTSLIPNETCPACKLLTDYGYGQHGILSYTSGYDLGDGDEDDIAEGADSDWHVETDIDFTSFDYGYDFWSDYLSEEVTGDVTGPDISGLSSGVYNLTGGSINGNIASGEYVVLLADGAVAIDSALTVENGGFLMVVSNNTATIEAGADNVEGVFIADVIETDSDTDPLVAEGTFVGWSSVNLQRDFDSVDNNDTPAEVFTFRPDFIINAPDVIKKVIVNSWDELNP